MFESKSSSPPPGGPNATEPTPSRTRMSAGELVGDYRLILELASGGMASVHAALVERHEVDNRLAAVKLLHPHLVDDPTHRAMFLDEGWIASGVRHPNVCQVFDFGEEVGIPYIAMEYLLGEPASAIWTALSRDFGPVDARRRAALVTRLVSDVAEALHAAHEARSPEGVPLSIVHRDVSPENLVVTYDGIVKLCDFGIATADRQEHLTQTGIVKGKYAYIQPEVLGGLRPDRRSDIFSLGVVLWELLTGERLFRRDSAIQTLKAVAEGVVAAPSTLVSALPPELDAPVLRALSSNPDERFSSAVEFRDALAEAMMSSGGIATVGDLADWMAELFPHGRVQRERLVERAAAAYAPPLSASSDDCDNDESDAPTVAIEWGHAERRSLTPVQRSVEFAVSSRNRRNALVLTVAALVAAVLLAAPTPRATAQPDVQVAQGGAPSFHATTVNKAAPVEYRVTQVALPSDPNPHGRGAESGASDAHSSSLDSAPRVCGETPLLPTTERAAPERKRERPPYARRMRAATASWRPFEDTLTVSRPLQLDPLVSRFAPLRLTPPEVLQRKGAGKLN